MEKLPRTDAFRDETQLMLAMVSWIAIIHFVVEALIMGMMSGWNLTSAVVKDALIDSTSLTIISTPLIYYLVARPFITSARDARMALARELDAQARQAAALETALSDLKRTIAVNEDLQIRLQRSNQSIADINERTLQQIGSDLHDGPAQLLTFCLLRLGKLAPAIETAGGQGKSEDLVLMRDAITDSLSELRNISQGLCLPKLSDTPLAQVITLAVAQHEERTGTRVACKLGDLPADAAHPVKTCVYRVVQESLANAYKHAQGLGQQVRAWADNRLMIEICDEGPGIAAGARDKDGLGLLGMRARVEALGGVFSVRTGHGAGTCVNIALDAIERGAGNVSS